MESKDKEKILHNCVQFLEMIGFKCQSNEEKIIGVGQKYIVYLDIKEKTEKQITEDMNLKKSNKEFGDDE